MLRNMMQGMGSILVMACLSAIRMSKNLSGQLGCRFHVYSVMVLITMGSPAISCSLLRSVMDLEDSMVMNIDATPGLRLLNLTDEIGCANPGRDLVVAPIKRFTDVHFGLSDRFTILLPFSALHEFLHMTLSNASLAQNVAGVLVEFQTGTVNQTSPDKKFPQGEFSSYGRDYHWNPLGSGDMYNFFNFPVFILSSESTKRLQEVAVSNEYGNFKYPMNVAEFDFILQTTKSGTRNSKSCLRERSCLPLGGYSVWSALTPIDMSSSQETPIVLIVTSMDSASFFRELSSGADSSLSGMVAMLAAVDALSQVASISDFRKQLVFLVLTGEAWGYLGSRRFVVELTAGTASVAGLNISSIQQILEVGSVGQAVNAGSATFYAHKQGSEVSASTREMLDALQSSAASLTSLDGVSSVDVKLASVHNPGIPPSSLQAFLQRNSSTAAIVIEEFDESFKNNFYHSHLDNEANINKTAIVVAASLLARALYLLGHSSSIHSNLHSVEVNKTLVEELVDCLISRAPPAMSCDLVKSLITPSQLYSNHYVGVMTGSPSSNPFVEDVDDISRFVWNFLASRTYGQITSQTETEHFEVSSTGAGLQYEECAQQCSKDNEVCVGSTADHKGRCVISTTRYVPAYSPRLQYGSTGWKVVEAEKGDLLSEIDPVWTESYWKSLGVRVYLQESHTMENLLLLLGLGTAAGSFSAVFITRAVFRKRLKRA